MGRLFDRALWAGLMPNGLGQVKPNHYLDIVKVAWENRDQLPYAWRILSRGVCDGCALGTTGLGDFTMEGIHLCTVRLGLLRLNTMPALDVSVLADPAPLEERSGKELRALGRLPYPMVRRRGDKGFSRTSWEEALDGIATRLRGTPPERMAFYLTSRGLTNEVYYVAQKAARLLGTNNVDNSARICHSPSTVAMKEALGVGASTCSYKDWIGADLLVFAGSDVPNNQPVTTKYLYYARRQGTRVAVVNPLREPGLERYWVPSVFESALFGTRIADEFFQVHAGSDVAFFNGVLKYMIEHRLVDLGFIRESTTGFDAVRDALAGQSYEELSRICGAPYVMMQRLATMLGNARSAVFVWSMGLTQHAWGVDNVRAILNLALARGFVGRPHCGVMPIRGHSGVQGGAEVGAVPNGLPGGVPVDERSAAAFSELWGFPVPAGRGLTAVQMIEAAHGGRLDVLYCAGGNFVETLPDPAFVGEALGRVGLRVHQDIVVSRSMLVAPADTVVLLPACTRYEQRGGGTETTTERFIVFSPEIPGRRIGEARSEWEVFMDVARRTRPELADRIRFEDAAEIRREISRVVPFYAGIETLANAGDAVQWGGRTLCEGGRFPLPEGKARFGALVPPSAALSPGRFLLSTRRGRQFNSMVQARHDPLTGADRDDVFMNAEDATALGLGDGDAVMLRSPAGSMRARVKLMPIQPRNLQVHWPEGNVLIGRGVEDPRCGIPHYHAVVEVVPTRR